MGLRGARNEGWAGSHRGCWCTVGAQLQLAITLMTGCQTASTEVAEMTMGGRTAPGRQQGPLGRGWGRRVGGCSVPCICQAFTIMDQNRDGFIDKEDLRDTFAALGG